MANTSSGGSSLLSSQRFRGLSLVNGTLRRNSCSASQDNIRLWKVSEDSDMHHHRKTVPFKIIAGHHGGVISQICESGVALFFYCKRGQRGRVPGRSHVRCHCGSLTEWGESGRRFSLPLVSFRSDCTVANNLGRCGCVVEVHGDGEWESRVVLAGGVDEDGADPRHERDILVNRWFKSGWFGMRVCVGFEARCRWRAGRGRDPEMGGERGEGTLEAGGPHFLGFNLNSMNLGSVTSGAL